MSERNCNKCIHHTRGMCDSWDCKMQTVEDAKKEAVDEYVKVVVNELEENSSRYTKKYNTPYGNNGYKDVKAISIHKAIEIVKQGGVADDFCEWKQTSTAKYKTECGYKLEEYFDTKACYCKQCGKKIKVVD